MRVGSLLGGLLVIVVGVLAYLYYDQMTGGGIVLAELARRGWKYRRKELAKKEESIEENRKQKSKTLKSKSGHALAGAVSGRMRKRKHKRRQS